MIGALLIAGAVGLLAGAAIAIFWKDIIKWVDKAINKIKQMLNVVVQGSEVFLKKVSGGYKEVAYHYSKLPDNKWQRTTTVSTKFIDENSEEMKEIDEDILAKAEELELNGMLNITTHVEAQIMTLNA